MMNERIKELAEQAGFYVSDNKIHIPTTSEDITACQTKFAELIVKECIKACDGNHEYKNHTDTFFGKGIAEGIQICKIQIADRFGVE